MIFLLKFFGALLALEVLFRLAYYLRRGRAYCMIPKVAFKKMYVLPHPYLPYVYKKNFANNYARPAEYPLNKAKGYLFVPHVSNNLGNFNGPGGSRDVVVPKPDGLIRINCLGASTTGNYIFCDGIDYSYPMELEKIVLSSFKGAQAEVNNFGIGGWTSAEILVDFLLNGLDTSPDIVVLYHAYNDLGPSLTPAFRSDYSHARKNLGESYHLYRMMSLFPSLPLAVYNWAVNRFIGQNISHTLISSVTRGTVDYSIGFQGFDTYRRNIESLITICLARNIGIVLSTFCYYIYDAIKDDPMHAKLHEGVLKENEIIKELSLKYNVPLVDNYRLIPRQDKYFVDSVHFTPEGMNLIAQNLSVPVHTYAREKCNDKKDHTVAARVAREQARQ
ncbi:MAG: SGNH/GDSL hydrolase family protein [Candidatus Omnitrophica bacterium]|nr:SGNH/GDSL hydrolase family protein [Candidatus Omnitrophota bacterium]MDD5774432.1 SGNH/GDSL hydrolase family protein [Candidatus Omnitrophota bacterium]